MGTLLAVVSFIETMPLGILISITRDHSLRRPPRFWARFAGFVLCITAPELILIGGAAAGVIGQQAAVDLLWGGFAWGVLLAALSPMLLFKGPNSNPGRSDDGGGGGPGPRDDAPPTPPPPIGGLPLPDAEQSSTRTRGPHAPRRAPNRRRPAREPRRVPSRVRPLLAWPRTLRLPSRLSPAALIPGSPQG